MIVKIYLDEANDDDLISPIGSMPRGERSARLKGLLRLALAGTGGLLVRVDSLERRFDTFIKNRSELSPGTPHHKEEQQDSDFGAAGMGSMLAGLNISE
jgi:hypothetical protein